jgi:hypothetical protein
MLDIMRKKAASWTIKVILGAIILSFAFFFGFSQLSSPISGGEPLAARVGDNGVSQKSYYAALNRTLEQFKESLGDNSSSDSLRTMLQSNVLNQLINEKVRVDFARSIGFNTPPEVLAKEIKKNPNLNKDGFFDIEFYRKSFRPYFQRQFGVDYEKILEEDLVTKQFSDTIKDGLFLSPVEQEWINSRPAFNLTLEKVEIPPKSLVNYIEVSPEEVQKYIEDNEEEMKKNPGVPSEVTATQKVQDQKANSFAEKFAQDMQGKWMSGKLSKSFLEKYNLKKETLDQINLNASSRIFFQEIPHALIAEIFSLSEKNRFLSKPAFINGNYYVLRLVKNDVKPKDTSKDTSKDTGNPHFSDFYSKWLSSHRDNVQIESFINN